MIGTALAIATIGYFINNCIYNQTSEATCKI